MIVDMHTHLIEFNEIKPKTRDDMARCGINPEKWNYSTDDFIKGTSAADKVFVFGLRAIAAGFEADDEKIAKFACQNSRYVFFASVDPAEPDFMDKLRYAHTNLGCKGLKLGPVYQGVHPHDKRYLDIYAYCQKEGLPIITHMAATFSGGLYMEYARPILMDKVACDYPGLKIILAHLGHPWIEETVTMIRQQPNLYADISALHYRPWQFYNAMRTVEEYGAAKKVFFGSDFPASNTLDTINGLKNANSITEGTKLPPVSVAIIDEVLYKNPLSVLEIE